MVVNVLELDVYKFEICGCCGVWIEYLEVYGVKVSVYYLQDFFVIKVQFGVGNLYEFCYMGVLK